MLVEWMTGVLQYVVSPFAGGIVGYLLKAYVDRRDNRRALIKTWKQELLDTSLYFGNWDEDHHHHGDLHIESEGGLRTPEESFSKVVRRSAYASFKPHMSRPALAELEKYSGYFRAEGQTFPTRKITIIMGATESPVREIIGNEIYRIEKAWKLI
jgi:hypothetical protein